METLSLNSQLAPGRQFPLLEDILTYQNEEVVSRFSEDYGLTLENAEEIFIEVKRWLWLCAKRKVEVDSGYKEFLRVPLFNEAYVIDLMWHTFLLFTQDYADFCDKYFGFYIHHHPRPKAERLAWQEKIKADPLLAKKEREDHLRAVYEYLYDELGEEILVKWCEEFPVRFNVRT